MTEIFYRNLGTGELKWLVVPTNEAEQAIQMIQNSDTLDYYDSKPQH